MRFLFSIWSATVILSPCQIRDHIRWNILPHYRLEKVFIPKYSGEEMRHFIHSSLCHSSYVKPSSAALPFQAPTIHSHYHYCLLHHNHCHSQRYPCHDYCHCHWHHPYNHRHQMNNTEQFAADSILKQECHFEHICVSYRRWHTFVLRWVVKMHSSLVLSRWFAVSFCCC